MREVLEVSERLLCKDERPAACAPILHKYRDVDLIGKVARDGRPLESARGVNWCDSWRPRVEARRAPSRKVGDSPRIGSRAHLAKLLVALCQVIRRVVLLLSAGMQRIESAMLVPRAVLIALGEGHEIALGAAHASSEALLKAGDLKRAHALDLALCGRRVVSRRAIASVGSSGKQRRHYGLL